MKNILTVESLGTKKDLQIIYGPIKLLQNMEMVMLLEDHFYTSVEEIVNPLATRKSVLGKVVSLRQIHQHHLGKLW